MTITFHILVEILIDPYLTRVHVYTRYPNYTRKIFSSYISDSIVVFCVSGGSTGSGLSDPVGPPERKKT